MNRSRGCLFLFILSLWLVLYDWTWASAASAGLKELSFLPQWSPQAQFAGFYMAQHKGYYRRHGIALTIIPGGPDRPPTACLTGGKADIVTLWLSSALQLADQGVVLVNAAQIVQRSALVLAVKTNSGIQGPADMNGKKIALWPGDFQIQPRAYFDKFKLDVRVVTTDSPVNLFLRDAVPIASLMWYNEYHTLLNAGLDPAEMRLFRFDEVDLNFPEDGIYLLRETFEKDPEAVRAFVAASMEGWREAFAQPDAAVDLMIRIMDTAHLPANRVHQRWMLDRMRDLMQPVSTDDPPGRLRMADYQRVGDILLANGLIHTLPSYPSFCMQANRP
jgi:NitT/TauT family transport system substrate-binding protein